jgi:hypothetical protein
MRQPQKAHVSQWAAFAGLPRGRTTHHPSTWPAADPRRRLSQDHGKPGDGPVRRDLPPSRAFLAADGALRLIKAYDRFPGEEVRTALVEFVESIRKGEKRAGRRRQRRFVLGEVTSPSGGPAMPRCGVVGSLLPGCRFCQPRDPLLLVSHQYVRAAQLRPMVRRAHCRRPRRRSIVISEGLARPYVCGRTSCPPRQAWC